MTTHMHLAGINPDVERWVADRAFMAEYWLASSLARHGHEVIVWPDQDRRESWDFQTRRPSDPEPLLWQVKRAPFLARYVNGGNLRPEHVAVIVYDTHDYPDEVTSLEGFAVWGIVLQEWWHFGPPYPGGVACHYVPWDEVGYLPSRDDGPGATIKSFEREDDMAHGRRKGRQRPNSDMAVYPPDAPRRRGTDAEQLDLLGSVDVPPAILPRVPELPPEDVRREQWRTAGARRRARVAAASGLGWAFPNDVPRGLGDNPGTGRKAVIRDVDP
jgi:hypothetical protein